MKTVYLDNNATTQVAPEVVQAMAPFFDQMWGNPSSMHIFGGQVRKYIDKARSSVAELIGADPSEIVFTGCGTESDNTAIRGAVEAAGGRCVIVTTRVEHPTPQGQTLTIDIDKGAGLGQRMKYAKAMEIAVCGSQVPPDSAWKWRDGRVSLPVGSRTVSGTVRPVLGKERCQAVCLLPDG